MLAEPSGAVQSATRLIGDAREGRPVPHVGLPAKTAGPWRAWEAGCPVRARAEITGKYAGEVREGVEEGQGADAGRGLLGHGLEPGQRAPAPGGGGRAPAGPWEAGARGQGPQVLLTGALKILQRVWAAGGGQCGKRLKESMPAGRTCWRRGGEIRRRAPPRTRPSGPGRVAMSATGHRPLSRPGRGPRRARPVHGQGPVPAFAAPSRSAGPAGEVEAEPGPLRGPSPSPTAVRCSKRGVRPDR